MGKEQGDAQMLDGIENDAYDFVHASHSLEHMQEPRAALWRWFEVVKPGGHIVVTVPDVDLYEHGEWPSRFNNDHKWAFTLDRWRASKSHIISVFDLLPHALSERKLIRAELIESTYDERASAEADQTLNRVAECAIEFVFRKV